MTTCSVSLSGRRILKIEFGLSRDSFELLRVLFPLLWLRSSSFGSLIMSMTNWAGTLIGSGRLSSWQEDEMDHTEKSKRPVDAGDETTQSQSDAMLSESTGQEPGSALLSDASKP